MCSALTMFASRAFLIFQLSLVLNQHTKHRILFKKIRNSHANLENTVSGLLAFLSLRGSLRHLSTLIKLKCFLNNILLLECCFVVWGLFEALFGFWSQGGNSVACYLLKLSYIDSVRGSQPCFPSSRLPFF